MGWPVRAIDLTNTLPADPGGAPPNRRLDEGQLCALMARYQQGDAAAVETLVKNLSPMLLRFCSGPATSQSDAEDMVQDCWLRVHRARHTYLPSEPLLPWIFAIARHARLDAYRRRRRLAAREVMADVDLERRAAASPPPETGVMDFVNRLPENQREVVVMLKVIGMSLDEVARATSSTAGAIKQKAHRAYEALREMMAVSKSGSHSTGGKG